MDEMAPLRLQAITIGQSQHQVGIFGCTLQSSSSAKALLTTVEGVTREFDLTFQLADATQVAGFHHLLFATHHALQAFQMGTQRATTLGMEILRIASGQRQIRRAVTLLGINNETRSLGGVLVAESSAALQPAYTRFLNLTGAQDSATALEINTPEKEQALLTLFQISAEELAATTTSKRVAARRLALAKIIFDRMALLSITR